MAGQERPKGLRIWLIIMGSAFFGNVVPFTLISWGELKVDSALAAILMAVMPLSTLILAHFFTNDEPLAKRKLLGIVVGFIGVVILIGPTALKELGAETLAQFAIIGGAICYSISTMFAKRLNGIPARSVAAGVMITSSIMVIPMSLIVDQPWNLSPDMLAVFSVIMLGLFATALGMLIIFKLIREQGASFLSMNNYMVPVFGVMWGALFLAERPTPESAVALVFILGGIAITRARLTPKK